LIPSDTLKPKGFCFCGFTSHSYRNTHVRGENKNLRLFFLNLLIKVLENAVFMVLK